jgi:mitochondrial fission protein ELM1
MRESVQNYYVLLEDWIKRYPAQWFWIYKRWKYCFTKRILVLKDERAGHTKQSEAVAQEFKHLGGSQSKDYEFEFQTIGVRYKSNLHRRLFFAFSFFALPFAQGRLGFLDWFLDSSCAKALGQTHADFIVSAGSSLAPLNALLRKENLAKSIVIMKPSFPYRASFFDLLIVPTHDTFPKRVRHVVRTLLAPNLIDEALLNTSGDELARLASFHSNGAKRISVFIGGDTKSYHFESAQFRRWLEALKVYAEEANFELLITTSRRTEPAISAMVKEEFQHHPSCKLLVIANESNIEHVTYGMLALSEVALVTEDSVSMISEAVGAGKNVLVMQLGNGKLPKKHGRFQKALESNALIHVANATDFRTKLEVINRSRREGRWAGQAELVQEALRKLL